MSTKKSHPGYRDSGTGEFVKEDYAKKNPKTTQKESIPNPGKGVADKKKR